MQIYKIFKFKKKLASVYAFNHRTQEAETGLHNSTAKPELHGETNLKRNI